MKEQKGHRQKRASDKKRVGGRERVRESKRGRWTEMTGKKGQRGGGLEDI